MLIIDKVGRGDFSRPKERLKPPLPNVYSHFENKLVNNCRLFVIPAKAGIQVFCVVPCFLPGQVWIPAFTGMTTLTCFDKIGPLVLLRMNKRQRKEEVWPLNK